MGKYIGKKVSITWRWPGCFLTRDGFVWRVTCGVLILQADSLYAIKEEYILSIQEVG